MRSWPGSALHVAESLLAQAAARRMAKRHAAEPGAASDASAPDATEDADAPPAVRVPILDVLGADELRLIVEALLDPAPCYEAATVAVHRLRCCARAFRNVVTNDDVTRHVRKLSLGHPYRAYRAPFGGTAPFQRGRGRAEPTTKWAHMPRQVFVGRRPRPSGVTRWSRREAPYELEVMPPEGSDELRYANPIIVRDCCNPLRPFFCEVLLLMDQKGHLCQIAHDFRSYN